jgi:hypothetical protein
MARKKAKPKKRTNRVDESPPGGGSDTLEEILSRMNGLIFLLADTFPRPISEAHPAQGVKAKKLKAVGVQEELSIRLTQAGLRPIEIAAFTGREASNIRRDVSKARKQGRLRR